MNAQLIEFRSKQCKQDKHWLCSRQWKGLGFIALCNCTCHEKKVDVSYPAHIGANVTQELHPFRGTQQDEV